MDRLDTYRSVVKQTLREIADITPSEADIRTEFICDDSTGHYQVSQVGWDGKRRVDDVFVHVDIIDGKVWLQHNGTDLKIADDFMQAGIPREDIVLAFHHPSRRKDTDFAVA